MTTSTLYQTIISYMDDEGRPYDTVSGGDGVVSEISGDDGIWKMFVQINEDDETRRVVIHSKLPARIPEGKRSKVSELLTRINYELVMGNFEFGLDNGEVFFKTTLDLADGQITRAMFDRAYDLNAHTMNEYFEQLLSAGFGGGVGPKYDLADGVSTA